MIYRAIIATALAATIAACDATPAPPETPTPITVAGRSLLPYAVTGLRVGRDRPSLAAYPAPATEEPGGATAYP